MRRNCRGCQLRTSPSVSGCCYCGVVCVPLMLARGHTAGINAGKVLWVRVSASPPPRHVNLVLTLAATDHAGGAVRVEMCVAAAPLPASQRGRGVPRARSHVVCHVTFSLRAFCCTQVQPPVAGRRRRSGMRPLPHRERAGHQGGAVAVWLAWWQPGPPITYSCGGVNAGVAVRVYRNLT